jgi:hypothetical protein
MKINREIQYRIYSRKNVFAKNKTGIEWVFDINIDNADWWVVHTWPKEPSKEEIESVVALVDRTIEVFERSFKIEFSHFTHILREVL